MDIKRVTRGDWVAVAGFVALLIGTSLSWYVLVETYSEGTMRYGVSGWAYTVGWLAWLAGLAAVVVVILSSGVIPQMHVDMRGKAPLVVMGLGAAALLLVLVGLFTKPNYDELVFRLQTHLSSDLIAKAATSSSWSNEVDSTALGLGIFVSLLGALAVAAAGFLKMAEPVAARAPFVPARPPVRHVSPPGTASPGFCSKCGTQFRSNTARFCVACGADRTLD